MLTLAMDSGKGSSYFVLLIVMVLITTCELVLSQDRIVEKRTNRSKGLGEPLSLVGPGIRTDIQSSSTEKSTNLVEDETRSSQLNKTNTRLDTERPTPLVRAADGNLGNIASLMQRQSERLSVLHNLAEQQLRRLDNLEYRLTRLEVQGQERGEASRVIVADIARHVQALAYQGAQLTSSLESVRQGQAEGRHALSMLAAAAVAPSNSNGAEVVTRLQNLANSVQNVRLSVTALNEQHVLLTRNVTELANVTRQLRIGQQNLVSRHNLAASLAEFRLLSSPSLICPGLAPYPEPRKLPSDCAAVQNDLGYNKSGIYLIQPRANLSPFFAYCELGTRGGGWTVIQNRYEGSLDFYRDWQDYKRGFGNLGGEFWLGLDKLNQLTGNEVNELLIELQDFTLDKAHAHYTSFAVGPEVESYPISFLSGYDGDAGDSLVYHAGMKFSTKDADHDQWEDGNCAESHLGAWWYNGCDTSNLNGRYLNGELPESHEYQGMYWYDWRGPSYSLMRSRMMVRPRVTSLIESSTSKASKRSGRQRNTTPTPDTATVNTTIHTTSESLEIDIPMY